jgi:hypothetical protein
MAASLRLSQLIIMALAFLPPGFCRSQVFRGGQTAPDAGNRSRVNKRQAAAPLVQLL